MRITGGSLKGLSLKSPKSSGVRPTSDKVRSAIFSKLYDKINNATVLDLFAGSGAFGIEALSRGAKEVVFVDKDTRSLKSNLSLIKLSNFKVIKGDVFKVLNKLKLDFNIIFIDPPYGRVDSKRLLTTIFKNQIIANDGILIYEESIRTEFEVIDKFCLIDEKRYGDTKIYYLELAQ
ncbi:16S rRNA (guanine(966)-N(2))-methyltransferase RsmD [Deferribacter autotrophicus]|uniref:16S rRNA (Guanine(966)-N(2))-methyltransferase RsmD n=1 Tax=Deferribacter autotrophicus TaxID=500465 RepID=A0A5A8F5L3_9BACT|nr:16S rRNA (guanine(966)-N(2))-methyltransferase RsmD [Deferribacter autotrophicus]KAA0258805.1 16S rRNA (guanine(966)-N(2))-methyltransferase RsmD [Deferribacter autotrophicus]